LVGGSLGESRKWCFGGKWASLGELSDVRRARRARRAGETGEKGERRR
jgi:hypothetical protein